MHVPLNPNDSQIGIKRSRGESENMLDITIKKQSKSFDGQRINASEPEGTNPKVLSHVNKYDMGKMQASVSLILFLFINNNSCLLGAELNAPKIEPELTGSTGKVIILLFVDRI